MPSASTSWRNASSARVARHNHKPKDGFIRDAMYSIRLPADLRKWIDDEAARRTLAGMKATPADVTIEALRMARTRAIWKRK